MRNLFGIFLYTLIQQLVCILKMLFGKKDNEESFWNIPFTSTQQLIRILKMHFGKKDNEESFWNIPFYIDPRTSLYSQKAFIKKGK